MNKTFLNQKVGSPKRKVIVTDITLEKVNLKNTTSEKVFIHVKHLNGTKEFKISDIWIPDPEKGKKIVGLWYNLTENDEIPFGSSLARLLQYYSVNTLGELINKEIYVYPDENEYLIIVAGDIELNKNSENSENSDTSNPPKLPQSLFK